MKNVKLLMILLLVFLVFSCASSSPNRPNYVKVLSGKLRVDVVGYYDVYNRKVVVDVPASIASKQTEYHTEPDYQTKCNDNPRSKEKRYIINEGEIFYLNKGRFERMSVSMFAEEGEDAVIMYKLEKYVLKAGDKNGLVLMF